MAGWQQTELTVQSPLELFGFDWMRLGCDPSGE